MLGAPLEANSRSGRVLAFNIPGMLNLLDKNKAGETLDSVHNGLESKYLSIGK